jgi:hypothetical protein
LAGRIWVAARSYSVGGPPSGGAIWPQIQIGEAGLPEYGAIVSQAGDGDRERLLQTSKAGEGRAPVRSGELEPCDGGIAPVPADDPPGEGVGLGRPGDSQLITSRPNNAEGIPIRACATAPGGAGSARMPVTAGWWLRAHAEASDPSDDRSPAAASSAVVPPIGSAFVKTPLRGFAGVTFGLWLRGGMGSDIRACACSWTPSAERVRAPCRLSALPRRSEPATSPTTGRGAWTGPVRGSRSIRASVEA